MAHAEVTVHLSVAETIPGVEEYTQGLAEAAVRGVYHRVCAVCVPEPHPGDTAICGAEIEGVKPHPLDLPCVRCVKRWPAHVRSHFGGRGA